MIFAGFTHEPAEQLARRLLDDRARRARARLLFRQRLDRVEVALKMALGYWRNIGEPRTRIVALEHGYHGDTIGTMSVGARGVFNAAYEPLLFDVDAHSVSRTPGASRRRSTRSKPPAGEATSPR